ncbi:MAG: hypothetical protein K1X74_08025 [Pirellulales bacterium]|nr:hypothetical protein [Pirellulales bacterium]
MFIAAAIVFAVVAYQQEQERKKAIADWADANGFAFDPTADYDIDERYRDLPPLQKGSNRYGANHLRGQFADRPFHAFDFHYETTSSNGKSSDTTHHWHRVLLIDAGLPFKRLAIRKEHLFDGVAEFFGWDDIDFESDEFSQTFHVSCEDRKFAYDVIDQKMMEYLLRRPERPLWMLGSCVVTADQGKWSIELLDLALVDLSEFLDQLPASLVRDLKEQIA